HRLVHRKGASVYAYKEELDCWRNQRAPWKPSDSDSDQAPQSNSATPPVSLSAHDVATLQGAVRILLDLVGRQVTTPGRNLLDKAQGSAHRSTAAIGHERPVIRSTTENHDAERNIELPC